MHKFYFLKQQKNFKIWFFFCQYFFFFFQDRQYYLTDKVIFFLQHVYFNLYHFDTIFVFYILFFRIFFPWRHAFANFFLFLVGIIQINNSTQIIFYNSKYSIFYFQVFSQDFSVSRCQIFAVKKNRL